MQTWYEKANELIALLHLRRQALFLFVVLETIVTILTGG